MAMLPVAADHAYEHKDGAPIVQLMASVFSELRLTEVSGGVEPSAAAGLVGAGLVVVLSCLTF